MFSEESKELVVIGVMFIQESNLAIREVLMSWLSLDSPASVSGSKVLFFVGVEIRVGSLSVSHGGLLIFSAIGDWSGSNWVKTWVIIMWTRARGNEGGRGGVEDVRSDQFYRICGTENFVNVFEEESHVGGSSENRKRI